MDNESKEQNEIRNSNGQDKSEPIVFVNNPIDNYNEDALGFEAQVASIRSAIEDGATMIGIVADYGTGKSSITDILCETVCDETIGYPKPIKINMWDCLQKQNSNTASADKSVVNEINDLTKSFLFQLANGKNEKLASYINKRLSNNYGVISFGLNSVWSWIWLVIAGIVYSLSKIPVYKPVEELTDFSENLTKIIVALNYLSPVLMVVAIILAVIGISLSCIAFSHWKMQKQSKNEVNDVFDTYEYIIKKLKPKKFHSLFYGLKILVRKIERTCMIFLCDKSILSLKKMKKKILELKSTKRIKELNEKIPVNIAIKKYNQRKQIIIIEDLDRVSDKSVIIGFLKELYRFQTSMEEYKDRFVFVVSIKPEAMLKEVEGHTFEFDDDKIYSKIFDFVVSLRPFHYDDYDSVLIALIENKEEKFNGLFDEHIKGSLPQSFKWIKAGTNLTIRDLKERLNCAVAIMVDLKNRKYENTAEDFEACAAVAYLEHRYPSDYNELIQKEVFLSDLINESYKIKNKYYDSRNQMFIKMKNYIDNHTIGTGVRFGDSFVNDLIEMIISGTFDEDFRMYFYTYPKGSLIKTTDEKIICDSLELHYNGISEAKLKNSIKNIFESSDKAAKERGEKVVDKTLRKLESYPDTIFYDNRLLEFSLNINNEKVYDATEKFIFSKYDNEAYCVRILKGISNLKNSNVGKLKLLKFITNRLRTLENDDKYFSVRSYMLKVFGDELFNNSKLDFGELFDADLITEKEIEIINNTQKSIMRINPNLINKANLDYICKLLNKERLRGVDKEVFDRSNSVYKKCFEILNNDELNSLSNALFGFMRINDFIDEEYFRIVLNEQYIKNNIGSISAFLNNVPDGIFEGNILEMIDATNVAFVSNEVIIDDMIEKKIYFNPLVYCFKNNCLRKIGFVSKNKVAIIKALARLNKADLNVFIGIRSEIIRMGLARPCKNIFFGEFSFITENEFALIPDKELAVDLISTRNFNPENVHLLCSIIGMAKNFDAEELLYLFRHLFDKSFNRYCIEDGSIIRAVVYNIDYNNVKLWQMDDDERNEIITLISPGMEFTLPEKALRFMDMTSCLFPCLELIVQNDEECIDFYIQLLNKLKSATHTTIRWIESKKPRCILPKEIYNRLDGNRYYYYHIIDVSLSSRELMVNSKIDFAIYIEIFNEIPEMFDVMAESMWFLEKMRDSGNYSGLNKKRLRLLYNLNQTEQFFSYVFNDCDDSEKLSFLRDYKRFETEEDSEKFLELICRPENMGLITNIELRDKIADSFWKPNNNHKSEFIKQWKKYFE